MSKWGNLSLPDISVLGKALKTVEKSIDKVIGIPDEDQLQQQHNQKGDSSPVPLSTSPNSYFGYSFTSSSSSSATATTSVSPSPSRPKVIKGTSVTPKKVVPTTQPSQSPPQKVELEKEEDQGKTNNEQQPQQQQQQQPQPQQQPQSPSTFQDVSHSNITKESTITSTTANTKDTTNNDKISEPNPNDNNIINNNNNYNDISIADVSPIKERPNSTNTPTNTTTMIEDEEDEEEVDNTLIIQSVNSDNNNNEDHKINKTEIPIVKQLSPSSDQVENVEPQNNYQQTSSNQIEEEYKLKIKELDGKIAALLIVNQEKERVLSDREKQISNLSSHISKLQATNDQMINDISRLTAANVDQKKEDIENLKEEFSRRIGEVEKRLKIVSKERDSLKSGQSISDNITNSLKEKDEQISQLLQEGTALSHKVLALESTIKKQRAHIRETDEQLKLLNDRVATTDNLLQTKVDRLKDLEASDKKYQDTISTMKEVTELANKKFEERHQEADKASKQSVELQSALEKAWKEITDLNKHHQMEIDRYTRAIEETRQKTKDEMQMLFNNEKKEQSRKEEALQHSISEIRLEMERLNERHARKEEEMNKHVQHLNQRCREAEQRSDQLSSSIPDTTRPLIKQIETLQSANDARQQAWEALEKVSQQQIKDLKLAADIATHNEQEAIHELEEMTIKFNILQVDFKKEKGQTKQLMIDLENEKNKLLEKSNMIESLQEQINQLKEEKRKQDITIGQLEERLEKSYKDFKEAEELRQREKDLEKERRENDLTRSSSSSSLNNGTNNNGSLLTSSTGIPFESTKLYGLRKNNSNNDFLQPQQFSSQSPTSTSNTLSIEYYQSILGHKEREIGMLQSKCQSIDSSKKKLEEELIKLTTSNEQLLTESKELKNMKNEVKDIKQRYGTVLELLGEKEEMVNELKLDIVDMKELYKSQINELLAQIEHLKHK